MAYTDLVNIFSYKDPLKWKHLESLAENDEVIKDHGVEAATKMLFFQAAAPTGWTKDATKDNQMLRVVSGLGGGTGGSHGVRTSITLAHTHSISTASAHTHTDQHFHTLDSDFDDFDYLDEHVGLASGGTDLITISGTGTATWRKSSFPVVPATLSSEDSHNHGGTSGSQLTTVTLAYAEMVACSKDVETGYTDITGSFSYGYDVGDIDLFDILDTAGENDAYNQRGLIEAGSKCLFFQAAAPTGWTKDTTHNNKYASVTSSSGGGVGGSLAAGTAITLAHASHTLTDSSAHSHTYPDHVHVMPSGGSNYNSTPGLYFAEDGSGYIQRCDGTAVAQAVLKGQSESSGGGTTGTDSHTHTHGSSLSDVTLAYVDAILCTKDSHGSDYTDMTAFFFDTNLLAYQDLNKMAANDDQLYSNLIPATSVGFFCQAAAPTNWTKSTSHNDKAIRVVTGTGGGSGGAASLSSTITLAHTHTVVNDSHTHNIADHDHAIATRNEANAGNFDGNYLILSSSGAFLYTEPLGVNEHAPKMKTNTDIMWSSATAAASHGHTFGSALSNVSLAYLDVIACTKDAF